MMYNQLQLNAAAISSSGGKWVNPQLEYCIQVWNPYMKQDMKKLEKVKRRATRMIQG